MQKAAVVILNWNGKKFLEKFLPDLIKYSHDDAEIIVADNNSVDDSVDFIRKEYPEIRIIINEINGGFSKGYNDALKQVESEYYILINTDVQVTENWIMPVIRLMDKNPEIAAVQPKILSYHEPNKFEYAGAAGGYIDKYGYPFCRGRLFQNIEEDKGQYNDTSEVFWATGACMFIRSHLFHLVGGFDDIFFAHMEEIDICWRLKNLGHKIMYCSKSTVYHVGGGTLPKSSSRKTYLNFRNNNFLLYKNLPAGRLKKVFIMRYLLDSIASLKFLIEGGFKDFIAVIRAHASFWKYYHIMKRKRKSLTQHQVSQIYDSNIAFDHYIKKIKYYTDLDKSKFTTD